MPRSGVYDAGTGRAIMAWRKVAGYSRTYVATADVFAGLLKGRGVFKVRHPGDGRHVEARINAQVLALINKGKVQRIYHTSSGAPATPTVRGKFRVYMKTPGTNAKGMVDSSYFIRGYAIHGYASVPPYNASHGCLRVPIAERAGDLRLAADRRRRLGRAVGLGHQAGEQLVHPAGGVGLAHAVRAAALAQDALDLLERVLAVEVAGVGPRQLERVRADLADRPQLAAPPDRRVDAVAGGAERGLHDRLGRRGELLRAVGAGGGERVDERGEAGDALQPDCASIARTSTVPSCGLGRMSHHRNV